MSRSEGAVYEGGWVDGMRSGKGRFQDAQGNVYEGDFLADKRHGRGKIVWNDGRIYDGEWEDDLRHGHGNFQDAEGNVYDGSFVRDAMEGEGTTRRVDGGSYRGNFVDGYREGPGVFTGKDGEGTFEVKGTWVRNKKHGPCTLTRPDGRVVESVWEHGEQVVDAKQRWKDAAGEIKGGVATSSMGALVHKTTGVGQAPSTELMSQSSALESLQVHREGGKP